MKRILLIIGALLLAIPAIVHAQGALTDEPEATPPASLIADWRVAVQNALAEVPGVLKDFSTDADDGSLYYELEIVQEDGREYDVQVDMLTGAVVRKEDEGVSPRYADYLSVKLPYEEAVAAALNSLPEALLSEFELDSTRDGLQYKVELVDANGVEQDVHIDATSGEILQTLPDYEAEELPAGRIALEEARRIAQECLAGGEVISLRIDRDDGEWKYEADIVSADGRYLEVEIDAESGEVLEEDWDD